MTIPIRCINDKVHGIYSTCGSLLGAIDNDVIYFHCSSCPSSKGNWIKVYRDSNGGMVIKKLPVKFQLELEDEIKLVE
jgi:hypothetical protein